jgi:hypothetical protein
MENASSAILLFKGNGLRLKLPAHRAGLPGNEISFLIVPLDPAYKAGLAGHLPVNSQFFELKFKAPLLGELLRSKLLFI